MSFDRRIFGLKGRGCRVDPETRQSVIFAPHSGDIVYAMQGNTAISEESEYILQSRERMLNPNMEINQNEVGEDSNIVKRVPLNKYVRLD